LVDAPDTVNVPPPEAVGNVSANATPLSAKPDRFARVNVRLKFWPARTGLAEKALPNASGDCVVRFAVAAGSVSPRSLGIELAGTVLVLVTELPAATLPRTGQVTVQVPPPAIVVPAANVIVVLPVVPLAVALLLPLLGEPAPEHVTVGVAFNAVTLAGRFSPIPPSTAAEPAFGLVTVIAMVLFSPIATVDGEKLLPTVRFWSLVT
jgi:hypothetical protein